MELRTLRYFLQFSNDKNMTAAAKHLFISESALSIQLKHLEQELHCTLFIRDGKQVVLTDKGILLARKAAEILQIHSDTINALSEFGDEYSGDLWIGHIDTAQLSFLADEILKLKKMYPNLRFHLRSTSEARLDRSLEENRLTFAVVSTRENDTDTYNYLPFPQEDIWGVLIPVHSPLAGKDFVTPEDLADQPLIVNTAMQTSILNNWFKDLSVNLHIAATSNLVLGPSVFAEKGLGIPVCTKGIICTEDLHFIPLYPELSTPVYLKWKKNTILNPVCECFIRQVQASWERSN